MNFENLYQQIINNKNKEYILTSWIHNFTNKQCNFYKRIDKIKTNGINEPHEFANYHFCCVGKFVDLINYYDSREGDDQDNIVLVFEITDVISKEVSLFNDGLEDNIITKGCLLKLYYQYDMVMNSINPFSYMDVFNNLLHQDYDYQSMGNFNWVNYMTYNTIKIKNYGRKYSLKSNYLIHFVENTYNLSEIKDYLENITKITNLSNLKRKINQMCYGMNLTLFNELYDYFYKLVRYKSVTMKDLLNHHHYYYDKFRNKHYNNFKYDLNYKYKYVYTMPNQHETLGSLASFVVELKKIYDENDLYVMQVLRHYFLKIKKDKIIEEQKVRDLMGFF